MVAPLISAQALAERHRELRLFDARPGEKGLQAFTAGHLPGALHADLESHLSGPVQDPARGGRHPLPAVEVFAAQLTRWGLHPGDPAVIYDDAGGANAAARMWWMLRAMGHRQVQVLDGGL